MSAAASARHTDLARPDLDKNEWGLVVELIERECRDLPLEIHRTATKQNCQVLRDRLKRMGALLDRLRPLAS